MILLCSVFMLNGKGKQPWAEKVMKPRGSDPAPTPGVMYIIHPHKPPRPGRMLAEVGGNRES